MALRIWVSFVDLMLIDAHDFALPLALETILDDDKIWYQSYRFDSFVRTS